MSEVIGFYSGGDGKEIYKDVLFNCQKSVQEAIKYGVGCQTCAYRCEDKCCSKARYCLNKSFSRQVFTTDIMKDLDYQSVFDSRNICEFYRTKAWHNSIRTIDGDFALCYPEYSEEEKKITYKRFENVFEAFEYSVKKVKEQQCKELERIQTISDRILERKKEYEEQGEFLSFIKREIPEVYRELRKEFERRKQYGW